MKLDAFKAEYNRLMDRTGDVRASAGRVLDQWKYNIEDRKFGPAFQDPDTGGYKTELDLAVFMAGLADRRAVVQLPSYKGRRASTHTEGEMVVSKENRHGRTMGLSSNKDVFSFSVLVEDANVITTGDVGKPRNFMLQDLDGTWHDGWRTVAFMAETDAEKKLFQNTQRVSFDYFVHPNRWASFYSRAYLLAKIAIERLTDEAKFIRAEQKRLRKELGVEPPVWPKSTKTGADKKETFWAFNSFVDGLEFQGEYCSVPTTHEGLEACTALGRRINGLLTQLRFHCRCTDFAFWKHGVLHEITKDNLLPYLKGDKSGDSGDPVAPRQPAWAKGTWQTGHKTSPKARTFFATMERDAGLSLRWRCWEKTERIAA